MNGLHEQFDLLAPAEEQLRAGEDWPEAGLARTDFSAYLRHLHDQSDGRDLPVGYVPMTTFWLVKDNQTILGESRLRHALTPELADFGGHIGYVIRLSQRRKGYGTLILKLTLEKAGALGIRRVRVTCDTDNIGSARIIERNGGSLAGHSINPKNGKRTSQYWIDL